MLSMVILVVSGVYVREFSYPYLKGFSQKEWRSGEDAIRCQMIKSLEKKLVTTETAQEVHSMLGMPDEVVNYEDYVLENYYLGVCSVIDRSDSFLEFRFSSKGGQMLDYRVSYG